MSVVVETWRLETGSRQSAAGWLPNIYATGRGPVISVSIVKPASHSSTLVTSRLLAFGVWRLAFGVFGDAILEVGGSVLRTRGRRSF
jgi:hypothetical protein